MAKEKTDLGLLEGLGEALRILRRARGLNQGELAEATRRLDRGRGVGKTSISGYERGHAAPTLPVLAKLLDAMEVSLSELEAVLARVRGHAAPGSPRARTEAAAARSSELPAYLVVDLREMTARRRAMPPASRQQILDLVDLARGLVEKPSVLDGVKPDEPAADGTNGDEGGPEGGAP